MEEVTSPTGAPSSIPNKGKAKAPVKNKLPGTSIYVLEEVELYHWDGGIFANQGIVKLDIVKQGQEFTYYLCASNEDILLAHRFDPSMNPNWAPKMPSFTWNYYREGEDGSSSWAFRFRSEEEYSEFRAMYQRCAWETLNQISFDKMKEDDKTYVLNNEDVEMLDIEDDEEDEEEVLSELDPDGMFAAAPYVYLIYSCPDSEESESEEEDYEDEDAPPIVGGDSNSQLTVGYKGDRAYVVRGNNIGVFAHNSESNTMKYNGTISRLATTKGKVFKPKNVNPCFLNSIEYLL